MDIFKSWRPVDATMIDIADITNRLVVAVIILLFGFVIGKLLGKLAKRLGNEIRIDESLKGLGLGFPIAESIGAVVAFGIYVWSVVWALTTLGIATQVVGFVSAVVVLLVLIIMILTLKDFVPNAMAGVILHHRQTFGVGDSIEVDGVKGKVSYFSLTETRVKNKKGDIVCVPNSSLVKHKVTTSKK